MLPLPVGEGRGEGSSAGGCNSQTRSSSIDPFEVHFPFHNFWNAYSPFRSIPNGPLQGLMNWPGFMSNAADADQNKAVTFGKEPSWHGRSIVLDDPFDRHVKSTSIILISLPCWTTAGARWTRST